MIKFAVYAKIKAGREDEFLAALHDYLPTVRDEPGTVQYDVCRGKDDPSTFLFFEAYETEEGSRAHTESEAFKAYIGAIGPLLDGSPQALHLIESAKG